LRAVSCVGAGVTVLVSSGVVWFSSVLPVGCATSAGLSVSTIDGVSVSTTVESSVPLRMLENSSIEMRSTEMDSTGWASNGRVMPMPTIARAMRPA
jgi:hypothetical protein